MEQIGQLPTRYGTTNSRFWSRVNKFGPVHPTYGQCWQWEGCTDRFGYGILKIDGLSRKAHRYSYAIHINKIPEKICVLHKCDNPACVNPSHLFLGTKGDNNIDCIQKGRNNPCNGERNGNVRLIKEQVEEIKEAYESGIQQKEIAEFYNISQPLVSLIVTGKRWASS